jgi:hypothetical protein
MTQQQLARVLYEIGEASARGEFDTEEAFRRMGEILDTLTPLEGQDVFGRAVKLAMKNTA